MAISEMSIMSVLALKTEQSGLFDVLSATGAAQIKRCRDYELAPIKSADGTSATDSGVYRDALAFLEFAYEELGDKSLPKMARDGFGVDMREGSIAKVDFSQKPYVLTTDTGTELEADTVIIATGASAKYLGLDDEKKYNGQGVSACATCDGFFYRKRTVAVVGGGDTACEEALYLAGLCKKVYMIVRKPYLRASDVMKKRVEENDKIEILYEHNTEGLFGEDGVEGAHVVKRKGEPDEQHYDIAIDGFFLAIGHKPNTDVFRPFVDCDETGYIKTIDGTPRTNVDGVFAAGDCADPIYRQAIVAAGSGCKAALEAERWLTEHSK